MISRIYLWIVIQLIVLFLTSDNVSADDSISEKSKLDYKWFVSIYGGINVEENLAKIVVPNESISDSNYLLVGALAREIYRYKQWFSFEFEGLVGKHFGPKDDQWEFAGLILGRWHTFPWDEYIDTSFAMGAGLSENSEISSIELQRDENAQRLLGFLAFEFTFGLPQCPRWDFMLRVHHRSGSQGTIGESVTNYLCTGLRFSF